MNRLKTSFSVIFLFLVGSAFGQISNSSSFGGAPIKIKRYTKFVGSPFVHPDFNTGTLVTAHGKEHNEVPMRYNAYEGSLEIINNGTNFIVANKYVKEFKYKVIGDGEIEFLHFMNGDMMERKNFPDQFVQVLYEDESVGLYKDHNIRLMEDSASPNTYGSAPSSSQKKFVPDSKYYLYTGNEWVELSKLNYRGFKKALPELKKQIKEIINFNDFDLEEKRDVREFMIELSDLMS